MVTLQKLLEVDCLTCSIRVPAILTQIFFSPASMTLDLVEKYFVTVNTVTINYVT